MNQATALLWDGCSAFFAVKCRRPARLRAGVFDLGVKDQLMPFLCHVDLIGHWASLVVIAQFRRHALLIKLPAASALAVCEPTHDRKGEDKPDGDYSNEGVHFAAPSC